MACFVPGQDVRCSMASTLQYTPSVGEGWAAQRKTASSPTLKLQCSYCSIGHPEICITSISFVMGGWRGLHVNPKNAVHLLHVAHCTFTPSRSALQL